MMIIARETEASRAVMQSGEQPACLQHLNKRTEDDCYSLISTAHNVDRRRYREVLKPSSKLSQLETEYRGGFQRSLFPVLAS